MVFTTGRFMLGLTLLVVLVFISVLCSIVITSLGEERAGLCACREYVCLFCTRQFLSFFSSTWCQGLAVACDCGTPWTFLLIFLLLTVLRWLSCLLSYSILITSRKYIVSFSFEVYSVKQCLWSTLRLYQI